MGTYVDNRTNGHQGTARVLGMNWTLGHVVHLAVLAPYLLVCRANRYFENPYFGGAVATVVHRACGLRDRIRRRIQPILWSLPPTIHLSSRKYQG